MTKKSISVMRVYDNLDGVLGTRVLVDRIWPRGVRKDALVIDEWARDVAPSRALRTWFGHDPERFAAFRERYRAELADDVHRPALDRLLEQARRGPLTLVTATKDVEHSHATVLADVLRDES